MKVKKILIILALCLIVFSPELGDAEPIGTAFTYQGRLIDANDVADGLYDFQFKLFDSVTDGNQLDGDVNVPDMDVIDGYFTLELDFDSGVFTGDARWLEIGIRPGQFEDSNTYTVLSPRQEITPAPYALYATTSGTVAVPLNLLGSSSQAILQATNTGTGNAIYAQALGSGARAVYGMASSSGSGTNYGGYFVANGSSGQAVFGSSSGSAGRGVYGGASGSVGQGVCGIATNSGNVTNYGGYFVSYGKSGIGVKAEVWGDSATGLYGLASSGSGTTYGVKGESVSPDGTGVYGTNISTGNYGYLGGLSSAVYGYSSDSNAGCFETAAAGGKAVYGKALQSGDVTNYGGYFESPSKFGAGVYGMATNSYGGKGVWGKATGDAGIGVYGETSGYINAAIAGYAAHTSGKAVSGTATGSNGTAVQGMATATSGTNYGVYGLTNSPDGYAGYFSGDVKITGSGKGLVFPDGTKQTTAASEQQVCFFVKRDASYTFPNYEAQVDFSSNSTVWENEGGGFHQASSDFVAPVSGIYTFHGCINFEDLNAGELIYAQLVVNSRHYEGILTYVNGSTQSTEVNLTVHLNAGDNVYLKGYVSSSTVLLYGNSSNYAFTYFNGARVF